MVFLILIVRYFNENYSGINFLFPSSASQSLPLYHTLPLQSFFCSGKCDYKTDLTGLEQGTEPPTTHDVQVGDLDIKISKIPELNFPWKVSGNLPEMFHPFATLVRYDGCELRRHKNLLLSY